jgi:hypothetical protein
MRKSSGSSRRAARSSSAERVRLRQGQVLEMAEHRHAQLLEARKGQLHL